MGDEINQLKQKIAELEEENDQLKTKVAELEKAGIRLATLIEFIYQHLVAGAIENFRAKK